MKIARITSILRAKLTVSYREAIGKRGLIYSLLFLVSSAFMAWGTWYVAKDAIDTILTMFLMSKDIYRELCAIGSVGIVFLIIVLTAMDMVFSHTLNLGQRSGDGEFLLSLPVEYREFFLIKTLERALTDGVAHVFALPLFLVWGTIFHPGVPVVLYGLIAYSIFQVSLSSLLTGLSLTLQTFFTVSAVKKIVNWFGFGATALFLSLQIVFPHSDLFPDVTTGFFLHPYFDYLPTTWLSGFLIWARPDSTLSLSYLGLSTMGMALLFGICGLATSSFINYGYSAGAGVNSTMTVSSGYSRKRFLAGLWWKEFTLAKRDSDLLINGFLLPVTIFLISSYGIHSSLPWLKFNIKHIFVITILFLGYFHGFGAMNSIGSEGKSIYLLSSWYISPFSYVLKKALFWGLAGFGVSAALYLFVCTQLLRIPLRFIMPERTIFLLAVTSVTMSLITTSLSALFANFEAKFLQQASSVGAKALHFMMVLILALCLYGLTDLKLCHTIIAFVTAGLALMYVAGETLRYSCEEGLCTDSFTRGCLAFCGAAAISGLSYVVPVIPAILLSDLPRAFTIALVLLSGIHIIGTIAVVDFSMDTKAETLKERLRDIFSTGKAYFFREQKSFRGEVASKAMALIAGMSAASIGTLLFGTSRFAEQLSVTETITTTPVTVLIFVNLCLIMPFCEEILFRHLVFSGLKSTGWGKKNHLLAAIVTSTLFALIHPLQALGTLFLAGMVFSGLYVTRGLGVAVVAHSGYNLLLLLQQYF